MRQPTWTINALDHRFTQLGLFICTTHNKTGTSKINTWYSSGKCQGKLNGTSKVSKAHLHTNPSKHFRHLSAASWIRIHFPTFTFTLVPSFLSRPIKTTNSGSRREFVVQLPRLPMITFTFRSVNRDVLCTKQILLRRSWDLIGRNFRSGGENYCFNLRDSLWWQQVSLNRQNLQTIRSNLSFVQKNFLKNYSNEQNDWVLNKSTISDNG